MQVAVPHLPTATRVPPSISSEALAALWIARRARVTLAIAATIRELAGLGPQGGRIHG